MISLNLKTARLFPTTLSNRPNLKSSWKTAHPTLNTPDKVANYLYGTSNNGTADTAVYSLPAGVSCSAGAGACSSGAAGGGILNAELLKAKGYL